MKVRYKIKYKDDVVKEWVDWQRETGEIYYDKYTDMIGYYNLLVARRGDVYEFMPVVCTEESLLKKKKQYADIGFGEGDHPDYKEEQPVKSSWDARGDDWYL